VLTLALHVLPMNYVLAGSTYLAIVGLFPMRAAKKNKQESRTSEDEDDNTVENQAIRTPNHDAPLAALLRDWLPFAVSAAITAGVAPLLFVQLVYRRNFYTANLLLSWRWMIVIPVLIVAFYLLYLLKSKTLRRWPYVARAATGVATAGCFLFVAFCWTANHLLSIAPEAWPTVYETQDVAPVLTYLTPRLVLWVGGAFAAMSMIAGWQLFVAHRRGRISDPQLAAEIAKLTCAALVGLIVAVAAGSGVLALSQGRERELLFGSLALPYVIVAIFAAVAQVALWIVIWRAGRISWLLMSGVTAACVVAILCVATARESFRLAHVDITELFPAHAESIEVGGFFAFAAFALVNLVLIAGCLWLVRSQRKPA
jgi:hypothetical protein